MVEAEGVVQIPKKKESWIVHACNPITQETEAGVSNEFKTYLAFRVRR